MKDVQDFIDAFEYKRGVVFLDGWQNLGKGEAGDCDDFALSVALRITGDVWRFILALITFRVTFWLVFSPSNKFWPRHVAVWIKTHGWIDSTNRTWRNHPAPHKRFIPLPWPWVLLRITWGAALRVRERT